MIIDGRAMTTETSGVVPLTHVCSSCGNVNQPDTDYCLNCGAPLGHVPGLAPDEAEHAWRVFGVDTPMVGRDDEVEQLTALANEVTSSGHGALVVLSGPEGLGKSRLIDALAASLENAFSDALLLRSAPLADDARPYQMFAELIRQRLYIDEMADSDEWRARLVEGATAFAGPDRGPEIAHRVGALFGVTWKDSPWVRDLDGDDVAAASRRALAELLRADAARNPLILAFDDLHRAGRETRELVVELHRALRDAPVLVLAIVDEPDAVAVTEDDRVTPLPLAPLRDEDVAGLVRTMLDRVEDLPDRLVERITERALGNPFAVESLMRIFIGEGVIDTRGNAWSIDAERIDEVDLPFDFEDVIAARLDRLDPDERELLENAALVGPRFQMGALLVLDRGGEVPDGVELDALWDDADRLDRIEQQLRALARRDLVYVASETDLEHETTWVFKHRVEQRLLARSVDADAAKSRHLLLAQWLLIRSRNHPERWVSAIGDHFEQAGRPTRAARCFLRVGELSRRRYANARAVEYLERARTLLPTGDVDLRVQVLHELGSVYDLLGDYERSIPIFEDLGRLSWLVGSRGRGGIAFNKLGRALRSLGEYDKALTYFERALELFQKIDDQVGVAATLDDIGRVDWIRGDYDRARERYERALELRRDIGDERSMALSLSHMGTLLVQRGQFKQALATFREALELRRKTGDLQGIAESLNTIGVIFMERGDLDSAARLWTEALQVAREAGDRSMEGILLNNLGEVETSRGNLDDAETCLIDAIRLATGRGDRRIVFDATRNLGVLESRKGRHGLAVDHVEQALEMARDLGSRAMEGVALRTLGQLRGQTMFDASGGEGGDDAESAFRAAMQIFESSRNEAELGRTWHAYGTWLIEQGMLVRGKQHLEKARDVFERLEMRRVLAETRDTLRAI